MDKLSNLIRDLRKFEKNQFDCAQALFPSFSAICRDMCYGTAQFVVVQGPNGSNMDDTESNLPVICAVGSNYYQTDRTEPCPTALKHYSNPDDSVSDHELHRHMRDLLDLSLMAHKRNTPALVAPEKNRELPSNCKAYASNSALAQLTFQTEDGIFLRDDYILIIANFCPFITKDLWSNFPSVQRNALLDSWKPARHLDPLLKQLRDRVDLWVGHGKVLVWDPFWKWCVKENIDRWMLTFNLFSMGIDAIHDAGTKATNLEYPRYC